MLATDPMPRPRPLWCPDPLPASTQCCEAWESLPVSSPRSPRPRAPAGACWWASTTMRRAFRMEKATEAEPGEKPKGDG